MIITVADDGTGGSIYGPFTKGGRALFNAFGDRLERRRVARWGGLRCGVWRDDIGGEHVTTMAQIPPNAGLWLRSSTTIRSRHAISRWHTGDVRLHELVLTSRTSRNLPFFILSMPTVPPAVPSGISSLPQTSNFILSVPSALDGYAISNRPLKACKPGISGSSGTPAFPAAKFKHRSLVETNALLRAGFLQDIRHLDAVDGDRASLRRPASCS